MKRVLILAALCLSVGFMTRAFAQQAAASPDRPLTRASAVALLVEGDAGLNQRAARFRAAMPPLPLFKDIDQTQWYAPYIEAAFEAGIVMGSASGTFRPADSITEEEAVVYAARMRARTDAAAAAELKRETASGWYGAGIMAALKSGLQLPFPIRLGQPMERGTLARLYVSAGLADPQTIAVNTTPPRLSPTAMLALATVPSAPASIAVRSIARSPSGPAATNGRATQRTPPAAPTPSVGFTITMPTLGITNLAVSHPADTFSKNGLLAPLQNGVGHLFSYPGKGGKILVYGHSSGYAWDVSKYTKIFRQINKLSVGDRIYVSYGGKLFTYEVRTKQTVPANDMSVYRGGGGEELILYTCWPPDSIAQRYLVHAFPVGEVAGR